MLVLVRLDHCTWDFENYTASELFSDASFISCDIFCCCGHPLSANPPYGAACIMNHTCERVVPQLEWHRCRGFFDPKELWRREVHARDLSRRSLLLQASYVFCVPFQLWKIVAGAAGAWLNASQARSRTADMRSFQVILLSLLVLSRGSQSQTTGSSSYPWIKTRSESTFSVGLHNIKTSVRFWRGGEG